MIIVVIVVLLLAGLLVDRRQRRRCGAQSQHDVGTGIRRVQKGLRTVVSSTAAVMVGLWMLLAIPGGALLVFLLRRDLHRSDHSRSRPPSVAAIFLIYVFVLGPWLWRGNYDLSVLLGFPLGALFVFLYWRDLQSAGGPGGGGIVSGEGA